MAQGAATETVEVQLFNDEATREHVAERTTETVTAALASLFSYAHQWARVEDHGDACTLTFSSMLAAMTASDKPLCHWLQRHLGLRGVASDTMTRGRQYPRIELPVPLQTTRSFRVAFEMARTLCRSASPAGAPPGAPVAPIDVRHFMAAYAVCPQYHLADFLRLRIDRRAWCLELAEQLQALYPEERTAWEAYARLAVPVPVLAFNTDAPDGRDLLNIDREVEAFARLTAARTTITPLSVGVFGAWGSGKSFFMRRVRERVARLAAVGRDEGRGSAYHGQIAQIEFNAWHYSEGTLIACLVDHIFRNLRIGIEDEDDATLRRRSADLIVQIDRAKQELADREHEALDAEARRAQAQRAVEEIDAKIPAEIAAKRRELEAAKAALGDAQRELAQARERKQAAVDAAIADAPRRAAIAMVREEISYDKLASAAKEIRELIRVARQTGTRWLPIVLGLLVLGIGLSVVQLSGVPIYAHAVSAVTALAAFAVTGRTWLHKLDGIAKRGEAYQAAEARIAKESVDAVEAAHKGTLDALAAAEKLRADAINAIGRELDKLASSSSMARDQLRALEQQRAAAVDKHAQAAAEVAARKQALAALSTGSLLGEFLADRAASDGYRKQLTIFTQVRNDFERLSKLIERATAEYYRSGKPPPTVSRIVLYVDDLDRCPEDKVIEVLRVVHLMLAFPLFVCFVAVDPRWVTACLKEAPGLADHDHAETGAGEAGLPQARDEARYGTVRRFGEELGRPATPADYLEKIFQIPLWLRPVPEAQRPAIVRALLDPSDARDARLEPPAMPHAATPASVAPPASAAPSQAGPSAAAPGQPASSPASSPAPSSASPPVPGAAAHPAVALSPDLAIGAVELAYLDQLGGLLDGNPRALKRFVNTYRLVKSALSDVELQVFHAPVALLGQHSRTDARYLPYRMCMAQLAVLSTQRARALEMVRLADSAAPGTMLGPWLKMLESKVDMELSACFRAALTPDTADLDQVDLETFTLWLERTRRYSFYL